MLFVGGAAGKLVCGYLGARIGLLNTVLLTEGLTAFGIIALLPMPLPASLVLMPLLGTCLNGTSSALYGTVPELVVPTRRARAFGIFYTGAIAASAATPPLIGLLGDGFGRHHRHDDHRRHGACHRAVVGPADADVADAGAELKSHKSRLGRGRH